MNESPTQEGVTVETTTTTPKDHRKATCWLNYPSAVVPDPFRPMGPNLLGELLWPVEVTPDAPYPGWTRVGFSLIAPPGVNPFFSRANLTGKP